MNLTTSRPPTTSRARLRAHSGQLAFIRARELHRAEVADRRAMVRSAYVAAGLLAGVVVRVLAGQRTRVGAAAIAAAVAAVVATLLCRHRLYRVPEQVLALRAQARAEVVTAAALDRLVPVGYRVLHDRVIAGRRGERVHHLVIGPGGIALVQTRRVAGALWWSGSALWDGPVPLQLPLEQLCASGQHVADALSSAAVGGAAVSLHVFCAFLDTAPPPGMLAAHGVLVTSTATLARQLVATSATLSPLDVALLHECATRALPPAA